MAERRVYPVGSFAGKGQAEVSRQALKAEWPEDEFTMTMEPGKPLPYTIWCATTEPPADHA